MNRPINIRDYNDQFLHPQNKSKWGEELSIV